MIGIWELLLLFLIVLVLFGTKKLRNIGGDLGAAIRSFRSAMREEDTVRTGADGDRSEAARTPAEDKEKTG